MSRLDEEYTMHTQHVTRRQFLKRSATMAGLLVVLPYAGAQASRRSAVDQVALGKTGLKLSRLGIGGGSKGGSIQRNLGQEKFTRLIRHAYDQGITYIDTADGYKTHTLVRTAIKGLPREKLFIQSKMGGVPEKPLAALDRFRQELGVDYIDSLLVHCTVKPSWNEDRKRLLDAFSEAKEKQIIRAHGVSCHSLPALTLAAQLDWVDVNLVRINPQGAHIDTPAETWNAQSNASHLPPVLEQIRIMREQGHGIIGMKIIGNGDFTQPEDREKSIRFAMNCGLPNAIVIGFKNNAEIDEAIERMNRALAEPSDQAA